MEIGIITSHYALNAGAILQAFALQSYLTNLGHDVEFIDYRPDRKYSFRSFIAKSPSVMLNKWKDIYNDKKYTKADLFGRVLKRSKIRYLTEEQLIKNPPIYDLYITGSDQVWNFYNKLSSAYLLSFAPPQARKVAYAVSMGQCKMNKSLYQDFKDALSDFEAISLREKNGVEFVSSLFNNERTIRQTIDPTLLIPIREYDKIVEERNNNKLYIASYILTILEKEYIPIIEHIKEYYKCPLINLRNPSTCIHVPNAKNRIVTPYQWLYFIKNSKFVISGSFHAIVFSLLFHKPFVVLIPATLAKEGGNYRINSLLESVGLLNRCFFHPDINKIEEILVQPVEWQKIDAALEKMRKQSIDFLNDLLSEY